MAAASGPKEPNALPGDKKEWFLALVDPLLAEPHLWKLTKSPITLGFNEGILVQLSNVYPSVPAFVHLLLLLQGNVYMNDTKGFIRMV